MQRRVNRWVVLSLSLALLTFSGCESSSKSTGGPSSGSKTSSKAGKAGTKAKTASTKGKGVGGQPAPVGQPPASVWESNRQNIIGIIQRAADACGLMANSTAVPEGEEEAAAFLASIKNARGAVFRSVNEIEAIEGEIKTAIKQPVKPGLKTYVRLTNYHVIADNRNIKRTVGATLTEIYRNTKPFDNPRAGIGSANARLTAADGQLELNKLADRLRKATAATWHREPLPDLPTDIPDDTAGN